MIKLFLTKELKVFEGKKVLFIQDEYDNTNKTKSLINSLGINIVFTCVPKANIEKIYPKDEFPKTRFINNLTGYVSDVLEEEFITESHRDTLIAYRGRSLPLRYGKLGFEKKEIGIYIKDYCRRNKINVDIQVDEKSRIYGDDWEIFMRSSKAMLGSESGSNVFDFDGTLQSKIDNYQNLNPRASSKDVYDKIVKPLEIDNLMNQLSPRIFEMASSKTLMILFEGKYSNSMKPFDHYLPLKKDYSNLKDILKILDDDTKVKKIIDRAYSHLIKSGKYSYKELIKKFDLELGNFKKTYSKKDPALDFLVTTFPKKPIFFNSYRFYQRSLVSNITVLKIKNLVKLLVPIKHLANLKKLSIKVRLIGFKTKNIVIPLVPKRIRKYFKRLIPRKIINFIINL